MKTALFSVHDRTDIVKFAEKLTQAGWRIIVTSETESLLNEHSIPYIKITDFTGISEDYGFPPTLHPKIENALTSEDPKEKIDLIYDIPYPEIIGDDVGGRCLLALAVKGKRIPVMKYEDMITVVDYLSKNEMIPDDLHARLIDTVNYEIGNYFLKRSPISTYCDSIRGYYQYSLANGENPYQEAALYSTISGDLLALDQFQILSNNDPCYTNLADSDNLVTSLSLASAAFLKQFNACPYICIASKHGNPCGFGINWKNPMDTIHKTLWGDPISIWGGEVITNFPIDYPCAELFIESKKRAEQMFDSLWNLDVIIAPSYDEKALDLLKERKFRKIFQNRSLIKPQVRNQKYSYRFVRGGFLRQSPPEKILNFHEAEIIGALGKSAYEDLIIAWSVAFSSFHGGNEIALVKDGQLIGVGGGPATVLAADSVVRRSIQAGHKVRDSIFAADAFFPFIDAPQILIKSGVSAGLVPAGGRNEKLVRKEFSTNNIPMVYLTSDFRGFCRH